ncbi:ABC transporter ATP-binding protein/permease [Catenovulum sp. SM1970]|uniref:ABCB family ABC transporter ATP-binding protein/permease n=1 Tax=Marinifaba aquimaris TaxID=2741323 RepID=UPI001572ED9C|nr:ABC transporter ATP-binding protein/permease [Marinifaba aquimaris]NTS76746.1 ABC transporter ATP-binding protein/permease [Marinifaba aquimaris]
MRGMRREFTENTPLNVAVVKQIIPYLLEYKTRIALALLCLVLAKVASIGLPFLLKHIVDDLNGNSLLVAIPVALILAYGFARLMNTLLGEIRDTLFGRVTERAMRRLGLKVFKHLHTLELAFHLERKTGGLSRDIDRGTNGISFLMRFMVFNIIPTLLEVLFVIGIFFHQYGWVFALVIFVAIASYIAFSVFATEKRTRFVRLAAQADSSSNTKAVDSLLNFETVKYFNNEAFEAKRYDESLADWEVARRKNRLSLFALNGGQGFIISASMTAIMLLAANELVKGHISIGDFVLINTFMMQLFMPLNFLGFVYREIRGSLANIENMFKLLAKQPQVIDKNDVSQIEISKGEIAFNNLEFSYGADRKILHDVSFTVPAGKKVAIVGDSGSGKSTLIKLLFRFYDLDAGQITIDKQAIDQVSQASLRQNIAIVPQDTVLFNDTLKANISYAKPDASDDEINRAVHLADLSGFVGELKHGLDTLVGERGLKLSGGEKQRVAIARAILKDAPILVFDEATSSLDSQTEQNILKALAKLEQNHTRLVIAHRLSTIVDADNIIVLSQGRIVEQGQHQALLAKQGLYAKLWLMQQEE